LAYSTTNSFTKFFKDWQRSIRSTILLWCSLQDQLSWL